MNPPHAPTAATPCPKCATAMTHVAMTRHPLMPNMRRNTFVCYSCNQTRSYMLPAAHSDKEPATRRA
jgi:hypothetical protein